MNRSERIKKLARGLSLLLAMLLLLPAFCGCGEGKNGAENTAAGGPEPENTEKMTIISGGESEYTIVRLDTYGEREIGYIEKLRAAIEEVTGVKLSYEDGYVKEGSEDTTGKKQLIVGFCDALEPTDYLSGTGLYEYSVTTVGDRIVMSAWCDWLVGDAVDCFISVVRENGKEGELVIDRPAIFGKEADPENFEPSARNEKGKFVLTYYLGPSAEEICENEKILADMAALGITRLELDGSDPAAIRKACEMAAGYGLDVALFLRGRIGWSYCYRSEEAGDMATQEEVDAVVKGIVDDFGDIENLVQWYLCDEPVVANYEAIRMVTDAFRRFDPERPALVNLLPALSGEGDYNLSVSDHYLDYVAGTYEKAGADFVTYDRYQFEDSGSGTAVYQDNQYMKNLLGFGYEAARHGADPGVIIQQYGGGSPRLIMDEEQFRWETNLVLAHGYKYIAYFTYGYYHGSDDALHGVLDENNEPNDSYAELKAGIEKSVPFGKYLAGKQLSMVLHLNTGEKYAAPEFFPYGGLCSIETDGAAVIGCFEDENGNENGKNEFFLVNYEWQSGADAAVFVIDTEKNGGTALEAYDPFDGQWKPAEEVDGIALSGTAYEITLLPGDAALIRFVD